MKKIIKRILKILLLLIILGLFGLSIMYLVNKSKKEPVIFTTASAFTTNIVQKTVATGSVVPRKEIEIKPKVSGIISEIFVEAGKYTRKGDRIARIKIIPDMVSLNSAESRLKKAGLNLEQAEKEYYRQKDLFEKKVIAEAAFIPYDNNYKTALEEVESAENHLQLIKEGVTKKSEGATNTVVRSTIEGMVLDVPFKEGNSVIESNTFNAGSTIATIADMSEMIFEGKVDESEVGKIKEGMDLILRVGAIENEMFEARLEYISPKGVEENGAIQFEIRAAVVLKDSVFIRAGYSANADIVLAHVDSVMAIQESLILFEENKQFVEIETAPQIFEKREITTGLSDGINIEVKSGITMEEKIKIPQQLF